MKGAPEARFAPVSVLKFVVLSICSFGIYQVAWIYRHWRHERDQNDPHVSPFWRTFFAPIWIFDLFQRISRYAVGAGIPAGWSPAGLAALTVALWLSALLRRPLWLGLISVFAFVPSIPVQRTVNAINARLTPGAPRNERFTWANIVLVIVGGGLLALVIWSFFVTPVPIGQGTIDGTEPF